MDDKLLQLYFEGRTTEEQSRLITEWLDADEVHRKHYQQLCRVYEISFWHEEPETERIASKQTIKWQNIWREVIKIAAVFLLGFTLNYWLNPTIDEGVEIQTVHVPAGQNAQITLADGSKVWLNAGSTLNFPTRFVDGKRCVSLKGEGFFEVQANKEKPFIVSTSSYDIKALGTSFNVNAYTQSEGFETALLTGKVEIMDRITERVVSLAPDNRAVFVNNRLSVLPIQSVDYFLWREGIIYFDEPLTEVLKKLELYFDVNIKVNNASVLQNKRLCTGKFRTRDGLFHILDVLQLTSHFTYEKDEDKNLITIN